MVFLRSAGLHDNLPFTNLSSDMAHNVYGRAAASSGHRHKLYLRLSHSPCLPSGRECDPSVCECLGSHSSTVSFLFIEQVCVSCVTLIIPQCQVNTLFYIFIYPKPPLCLLTIIQLLLKRDLMSDDCQLFFFMFNFKTCILIIKMKLCWCNESKISAFKSLFKNHTK